MNTLEDSDFDFLTAEAPSELTALLIRKQLAQSFPFEKARAEQLQAMDELTPWLHELFQNKFQTLFYGIDAPTGTGKSPLAIAVADAVIQLINKFHGVLKISPPTKTTFVDGEKEKEFFPFQVWIVTQNKLLQDQYNQDFKDKVFDLRGLDNYQCYHDDATCGQSRCARLKPPPKAKKEWKPPQYCGRNCEYDEVSRAAKYAPILLLNVAKALNLLKNPNFSPPLFMIFDEGHGVENALDSEASLVIDPKNLEALGYRFERYFQELDDLEAIVVGFRKLLKTLGADMELEVTLPPDIRNSKKCKSIETLQKKIEETLVAMEGIEFVSCSTEKVDIRPLKIHAFFTKTFTFPTLFLSATLLSKEGFCSMTGIDPQKMGWFSLNSPFPIENRQIFYWWQMGARAINYGNQAQEMDNLLLRIQEILDRHPNERGIIHTHTYKIATEIADRLGGKYWERFLFPKNSREQKEILTEHARSKNTVLLSPSMTEGVDLKDDLCRFAALCKVPYLPMGDPVVSARMEANKEWYSYRTAMTVVQAPGRGVRSETDHAVTYLLDPGFNQFIGRARNHFPGWFLESLVKGYKGGY